MRVRVRVRVRVRGRVRVRVRARDRVRVRVRVRHGDDLAGGAGDDARLARHPERTAARLNRLSSVGLSGVGLRGVGLRGVGLSGVVAGWSEGQVWRLARRGVE